MAPSAEFQKYRCGSVPLPLADVEGGGAPEAADRAVGWMWSYAHGDDEREKLDGDNPGSLPAFAPGLFKDPIFEKGVAITLANQRGIHYATE